MKKSFDYSRRAGKFVWQIQLGCEYFDIIENIKDESLPKKGAYCRKCRTESAKPVAAIWLNNDKAYALRCNTCGEEYPMYQSTYKMRYIGSTTPNGGRINPTHGGSTLPELIASMDRKAREDWNNRHKKTEAHMCNLMGCTPEEYKEKKKQWAQENAKATRNYEAEQRARWEDEKRKEKSEERKKLIANGTLKYVKNIGLVNTKTNEVVKL